MLAITRKLYWIIPLGLILLWDWLKQMNRFGGKAVISMLHSSYSCVCFREATQQDWRKCSLWQLHSGLRLLSKLYVSLLEKSFVTEWVHLTLYSSLHTISGPHSSMLKPNFLGQAGNYSDFLMFWYFVIKVTNLCLKIPITYSWFERGISKVLGTFDIHVLHCFIREMNCLLMSEKTTKFCK